MKRKAPGQSQSAPISAFAARKAKGSAELESRAVAASASPASEERPPKKPRSAASTRSWSVVRKTSREGTAVGSAAFVKTPPSTRSPVAAARDISPIEEDLASSGATSATDDSSESQTDLSRTWEDFALSKSRIAKDDIVYDTGDALCVRLRLKATLAIIGQYDLWVRRGVVSIFGAKLHPNPKAYRVYAPSTHSLPVLKCVSGGLDGCAEVEIRSCRNGLTGLGDLSDLYDRIWNEGTCIPRRKLKCDANSSFSVLYSASDDPLKGHLRSLHLDKAWSFAIKTLSQRRQNLRVLACGPKASGKSTFNKYLLNHLLSLLPSQQGVRHPGSGVAFLDLDPGQPEYSTPGHIYLAHIRSPVLGPSFSHPALCEGSAATTVRSHYIGFLSPKDDSDHYCEAIMDLMDRFHQLRQQYPELPLIINYPGWIFGQGLEIASWLVTSLGLSDLVYMSEKGPEEVVATLGAAASQNGVSMAVLPSQPIDYVSRSSSQLRSMQMLSYFHSSLVPSYEAPIWSNIPLARSRSFVVDYSEHKQGIRLILALGLPFDSDLLRDLLDGAVVGLVAVENLNAILGSSEPGQEDSVTEEPETMDVDGSSGADGGYDADDTSPSIGVKPKILRTKEGLPYPFLAGGICIPPDPKLSYSLGQAIVRSINSDTQTIDLITPIPPSAIRTALDQGHQLILVRGQVDSPNWAIGEEYFAASAALARHRHGMESQGGQDENTKPGLPLAEDLAARKTADSMMATKLRERIRRASNVPFMRPVGWEDDSKPPSRRKDKRLWKLRKRVDDVRDSPVGDI